MENRLGFSLVRKHMSNNSSERIITPHMKRNKCCKKEFVKEDNFLSNESLWTSLQFYSRESKPLLSPDKYCYISVTHEYTLVTLR